MTAALDHIRVMLVEDHQVVRQGLVALLSAIPEIQVVASASDGMQAVELFRSFIPDITLMDLRLPKLGGVDAIIRIRKDFPAARFIVLTTFDGDEDIFRAMQAGAKAYMLKGVDVDELLVTIRQVHAGRGRMSAPIAEKLAERVGSQELTPREVEVLERIVAGRSNKDIATDLFISEATVKSHVNSLLGKLGVADRTHAAITAIQRGIVHLN
jgi:DNA-binding NarL/FixJ family response regulator